MTVQQQVRILLAIIVSTIIIGITKVKAHGEGWPTNYQHFNQIRDIGKYTTKGTPVMFTLNDGTQVFGTLLKYERYTDYIWYQPQGTGHNWFKQDAFDVHELFSITVIPEPV